MDGWTGLCYARARHARQLISQQQQTRRQVCSLVCTWFIFVCVCVWVLAFGSFVGSRHNSFCVVPARMRMRAHRARSLCARLSGSFSRMVRGSVVFSPPLTGQVRHLLPQPYQPCHHSGSLVDVGGARARLACAGLRWDWFVGFGWLDWFFVGWFGSFLNQTKFVVVRFAHGSCAPPPPARARAMRVGWLKFS